ncbi:MAG: DUF4250 domain-containing protein [Oscillospiraceae bacterium]|nr:DUF4250 domain-containing protein [Oscillospiraceae bacterium]MDY2847146.1 DUF4250 domain-containing protein [Oscillospiraceae bacterium]
MSVPNDPVILFSYLNTLLRDKYPSLDSLCEDMELSKEEILQKLAAVGFKYDKDKNCFK